MFAWLSRATSASGTLTGGNIRHVSGVEKIKVFLALIFSMWAKRQEKLMSSELRACNVTEIIYLVQNISRTYKTSRFF
jgi:hypothetical protein